MKKRKILTFGELLWRFASAEAKFLPTENLLQIYPGGAEANVASSLGLWQLPCQYFTSLPENEFSSKALNALHSCGVSTELVLKRGDRIGLYFLLAANGLSTGQVVYDRKYSAFSQLTPGTIDWEYLFKDCSWFHWSAISPALNANVAAVCKEALVVARKLGLTVSVDLNYRSRLWDYGKAPLEVMPELVQYCDVVMGNIWAANLMLGTPLAKDLHRTTPQEIYMEHAEQTAKAILYTYQQCSHVAFTFRFMDNPSHNLLYGTYHNKLNHYTSQKYETFCLTDRIGSGDAFMAGLIFSLYHQLRGQEVIDFATSAGFLKLFVPGDFGGHTVEEIWKNISSAASPNISMSKNDGNR